MDFQVTQAHNGATVAVHVGDVITLQLHDNPSTGYRWSLGDIDSSRLTLIDSGYRANNQSIGGGGEAFWSLRTQSPGNERIEARRWRPWMGDSSVIDHFSLEIDIDP